MGSEHDVVVVQWISVAVLSSFKPLFVFMQNLR